MCNECEADGTILPSIESFHMGVNLPKVHYLFYEYFFRPVIGEVNWKHCFAERKRFGTNVVEAYAHALLENSYHAWVYDYLKAVKQFNHPEQESPQNYKVDYNILYCEV
jgi:hypothetical protein